jgi:hypothetical protein
MQACYNISCHSKVVWPFHLRCAIRLTLLSEQQLLRVPLLQRDVVRPQSLRHLPRHLVRLHVPEVVTAAVLIVALLPRCQNQTVRLNFVFLNFQKILPPHRHFRPDVLLVVFN